MKVYLYSDQHEAGQELQSLVDKQLKPGCLKIFGNIIEMASSLALSLKSKDIVILFVATMHELEELLLMQETFDDVRLILILPQRDPVTITKGHQLRPRYLTFFDNNMSEVCKVLEKMLMTHPFKNHERKFIP